METELKLTLPPEARVKPDRLDWLKRMTTGAPKSERIVSVYFDTEKRALHELGLTLRIRHIGETRVQTVKADAPWASFRRYESETGISGDSPDLGSVKRTSLARFVGKKSWRRLRPVFTTTVERTTLPIETGGSRMELSLDRGHIEAQGESEPVNEIEIELKSGDPAPLGALAGRLVQNWPAAYGALSKAGRGYALSAHMAGEPMRAAPIHIGRKSTAGEALRLIGMSCLNHAFANERPVREGKPEGIHQMRVGLQRLRAAISVFKGLLHDPETSEIKDDLKWLTNQLSGARDNQVLLDERVHPLRESRVMAPAAAALEHDLDARLDEGLHQAREALDDLRCRGLGARVALWLDSGQWTRSNDPELQTDRDRPAARFAVKILNRRLRKIEKRTRRLDKLDPRARHKVRIGVKRLLYAMDFFDSLLKGERNRIRHLRRDLKRLQSHLGTLNDIEVHKRIAASVARGRSGKALAVGYIAGQEQMTIGSCIASAQSAASRLGKSSMLKV